MIDIINNPTLPWNWNYISTNPNITIEFVLKNQDKISDKIFYFTNENFNWYNISRNEGIKMQDIINNPTLPWQWDCISMNPNITMDFVLKNQDKHFIDNKNFNTNKHFNWYSLSRNPGITIKDIKSNPTLPWEEYLLNPNYLIEEEKIIFDKDDSNNGIYDKKLIYVNFERVVTLYNNVKRNNEISKSLDKYIDDKNIIYRILLSYTD